MARWGRLTAITTYTSRMAAPMALSSLSKMAAPSYGIKTTIHCAMYCQLQCLSPTVFWFCWYRHKIEALWILHTICTYFRLEIWQTHFTLASFNFEVAATTSLLDCWAVETWRWGLSEQGQGAEHVSMGPELWAFKGTQWLKIPGRSIEIWILQGSINIYTLLLQY